LKHALRQLAPALSAAVLVHAGLAFALTSMPFFSALFPGAEKQSDFTVTYVTLVKPRGDVTRSNIQTDRVSMTRKPSSKADCSPQPFLQRSLPPEGQSLPEAVRTVEAVPPINSSGAVIAKEAGSISNAASGHGIEAAAHSGDSAHDGAIGSEKLTNNGSASSPVSERPDYIRAPHPRYPLIARQQGWEGTAVLHVEVRTDGSVGIAHVIKSSGHRVLDDAAAEAIRATKFRPAYKEGIPVKSWVEVPVNFCLSRG
jgi:TonB family protein